MNIGANIVALRKKNNITQEALASQMGVTAAAVSKWENNGTFPDLLMLCALADFFQVTTDELLGRNVKPICIAVASDSQALANQVQALAQRYGCRVGHLIWGDLNDALEAIRKDDEVTHLLCSFDKPIPEAEMPQIPNVQLIEAHCDNAPEEALAIFEMFLQHLPQRR